VDFPNPLQAKLSVLIKELFEEFEVDGIKLFNDEPEIIELLVGNYISEKDFHKRILSKLAKDIIDEFKVFSAR